MAKVQISIKSELLEKSDNFAQSNFLSRSGLISLALNQYLAQFELMKCINDMSLAMRKIADNNTLDKDSMNKLEDFERLAKLILSQK